MRNKLLILLVLFCTKVNAQKVKHWSFGPQLGYTYVTQTQRNNVQVLAPEQPKSQLEESIRKGMFQFKDIEPPEMIQFKHLLKQLEDQLAMPE